MMTNEEQLMALRQLVSRDESLMYELWDEAIALGLLVEVPSDEAFREEWGEDEDVMWVWVWQVEE